MAHDSGRRSYDLGASSEAQLNIHAIMNRLESLIGLRDADVRAALADWQATGVSDDYHGKEAKWLAAASETSEIIRLVKSTLEDNDGIAHRVLGKAQAIVQDI